VAVVVRTLPCVAVEAISTQPRQVAVAGAEAVAVVVAVVVVAAVVVVQ
jgi:hypothetical protein